MPENMKIAAVIVNFNGGLALFNYIKELKKVSYPNFDIIIVDNNSLDNSLELVAKEFNEIVIIKNKKNLGYTGGNNVGIKYALKMGAEYILISNFDIIIEDFNVLDKLVSTFHEEIKIGAVGPTIKSLDNLIQSEGKILFENKKFIFNNKRLNKNFRINEIRECDYVAGSFFLISKNFIEEVGLFDENYFLYRDEVDLMFRGWQKGFITVVNSNTYVKHLSGITTEKNSPLTIYYSVRNQFYFLKKFRKEIYYYFFMKMFLTNKLKQLLSIILNLTIRNKFSVEHITAFFAGIYDGFLINKYGKRRYPK